MIETDELGGYCVSGTADEFRSDWEAMHKALWIRRQFPRMTPGQALQAARKRMPPPPAESPTQGDFFQ